MKNKNTDINKIHPDEIDWLISIACSSDDDELKSDAFGKLHNFGLTDEQIKLRFKEIDSDEKLEKAFEKTWASQCERNATEKYTTLEKFIIFFWEPFNVFSFFGTGLTDLRRNNYKIKYRQRTILLFAGIIFWISLVIFGWRYSEYRRQQEIDKADTQRLDMNQNH